MSEGPTEAPRFGLDVDKDDLPEAAGKGEKPSECPYYCPTLSELVRVKSDYRHKDEWCEELCADNAKLREQLAEAREANARIVRGEFAQICSACGYEIPAGESSWEALREHTAQCPKHPLAKAREQIKRLREYVTTHKPCYGCADEDTDMASDLPQQHCIEQCGYFAAWLDALATTETEEKL